MKFARKLVSISFFATLFLAARSSSAGPCPFISIVLDRSGSMSDTPGGGGTGMSKWQIGSAAIMQFLQTYGDRLPIGFLTFQASGFGGSSCTDFSMEAVIPPAHGTAQPILQKLSTLSPSGGTNTGEAIDKVVALTGMSQMSMPGHPAGGYIILITDGEPNCNPGDSSAPSFTVAEITKANMMGFKTFAIGFGALPMQDSMNLDLMAAAGGEPCTGTSCNGHKYYAAESATALNMAIDAISQTIQGEFGGACDDSCYSNGCPGAGQICMNGMCVQDPCVNVAETCAPGDYCLPNGSTGQCVHPCGQPCPDGQVCSTQGMCEPDPCANVSCMSGQVCHDGACVTDSCNASNNPNAKACNTGLYCYQGSCIDDPCRYVMCPSGTSCVSGTGACMAGASGGMVGVGRARGEGGCDLAQGGAQPAALAALLLIAIALTLRARRRG
jgi:Mg-chelatase subunit ChlD